LNELVTHVEPNYVCLTLQIKLQSQI